MRELVSEAIQTDEGLISFLERLATTTRSTAGNYSAIRPDNLRPFTDYEAAQARVSDLAERSDDLGKRALRLKELFAAANF